MTYLFIWIVMGALVATVANSKGRNAALWFLYGVAVWPIALVHASLLHNNAGTYHPPGDLPRTDLWAAAQNRNPVQITRENHWFMHRDRRVEIVDDGRALVDGLTFPDADAAKAFLNEKYPNRA